MTNLSSEIEQILKKCFAIRSSKDIELIHNALDIHLTQDLLYNTLSQKQQLVLVKYTEFVSEFDNDNSYTDGLFVLLRGRATVSRRGQSLLISAKPGCELEAQYVLGQQSIPNTAGSCDIFFERTEESQLSENYRQGRKITIHFDKGSTYLVLRSAHSKPYLERLQGSLVGKLVLNDIGIGEILQKKSHEIDCNCNADNPIKVFAFKDGQICLKQGDEPDRVLLIATGSCLVYRKNEENEVHCVGSFVAPCFIGLTLFLQDYDICSLEKEQVSVVAVERCVTRSFCSTCFLASVSPKKLKDSFANLARAQMKMWTTFATDEDETSNSTDPQEAEEAVSREEIRRYDDDTTIAHDLNERLQTGRLKRSKILSTIHNTISSSDLNNTKEQLDVIHNREKWLLDTDKPNLLRDIMTALAANDCGIDYTICERNHPSKGPFHNFTTTSNGGNIDTTTDIDDHMSINMPPQVLNRIVQMEKCLGKERPQEYDNTDPLLKPYPSVVDRKMHGKTLPII